MNWTWNVRSNDGAMNGLEFARCTTAGGFGRVLIHAAPADAKIEIIDGNDQVVAVVDRVLQPRRPARRLAAARGQLNSRAGRTAVRGAGRDRGWLGHGSIVPVAKDRIWPNGGRYPSLASVVGNQLARPGQAAADYIDRNLPAWRHALR